MQMKKLIKPISCALLLFGFSSMAFADWKKLGTSADGKTTFYWNDAPIHRNGNIAKLWKMADETSPVPYKNIKYLSGKDAVEYDCANQKFRYLNVYLYSKNMGQGDAVYTDFNPSPWMEIPPESVAEMYLKVACKKGWLP